MLEVKSALSINQFVQLDSSTVNFLQLLVDMLCEVNILADGTLLGS